MTIFLLRVEHTELGSSAESSPKVRQGKTSALGPKKGVWMCVSQCVKTIADSQ